MRQGSRRAAKREKFKDYRYRFFAGQIEFNLCKVCFYCLFFCKELQLIKICFYGNRDTAGSSKGGGHGQSFCTGVLVPYGRSARIGYRMQLKAGKAKQHPHSTLRNFSGMYYVRL